MSLEHELSALSVPWPATPDVAATIADRLGAAPAARSRSRRRPWLRPALASLVALAIAAAAVPPVRAAIERLIGVAGGERIERVEHVPQGARLDLGAAVTLAQARRRAGFAVATPARLGAPDGVRLGGDLNGRAVSLLYGRDTVLTEIPHASAMLAAKQIGPQVRLRFVDVSGVPGIWIARGPRALVFSGTGSTRTVRRSALPGAGVLLWDRDGIAFRLETRRPFADALAIARSMPTGP